MNQPSSQSTLTLQQQQQQPTNKVQVPRARRRRSDAELMLHQIFSSRVHRILPICAFISISLCLPVLLVSNIKITQNIRHIKHSLETISIGSIPTPSIPALLRSRTSDDLTDESFQEVAGDDVPLPRPPSPTKVEPPQEPLTPYSLRNVLETVPYFHDTFAVIIYDPPSDKFIAHYSNNMRWISGCHKLITSFKIIANSLRTLFPDRFTSDSPEFALSISSSDYPGIKWNECFLGQRNDCIPKDIQLSPILQFGSVFRRAIMPTMIPMPMPQMNQLSCFHFYALHRQICDFYLPRTPENPTGLVFGETIGLNKLEDLIPQVVWRGSDFSYLHKMETSLRQPNFELDVASKIDPSVRIDRKIAATNAIKQVYNELVPRWKGVVWTAEAEREADVENNQLLNRKKRMNPQAYYAMNKNMKQARVPLKKEEQDARKADEVLARQELQPAVPWANIKFAGAMHMGEKTPTSEIEFYTQFEEYGIPAVGEGMSLEELGRYRYHIDIGGGGGTTWSGTLEKLGLPGLLFHHVTPTKDYLHDKIEPWVHYVPIKADLSDLHDKYYWAQTHPKMAQSISDNATELAKILGTLEGMDAMVRQFFEWPMRQVVEAYQPLEQGVDWKEAMAQMVGEELRPIMACGGYHHHDCEKLVDDIDFSRLQDRDGNIRDVNTSS